GNGLGIVTQSGGAGVMMTDRAEELGLTVPVPQPETSVALTAVMPAFGSSGNPVDVTGQFVAEPQLLRDAVLLLLADARVHVGIIWLQLMHAHADMLVDLLAEIRARTDTPFLICWVAAPPGMARRLRDKGIVMFGAGERAVEAAAVLSRYAVIRKTWACPEHEMRDPPPAHLALKDGPVPTVEAVALLSRAGVTMAPV